MQIDLNLNSYIAMYLFKYIHFIATSCCLTIIFCQAGAGPGCERGGRLGIDDIEASKAKHKCIVFLW